MIFGTRKYVELYLQIKFNNQKKKAKINIDKIKEWLDARSEFKQINKQQTTKESKFWWQEHCYRCNDCPPPICYIPALCIHKSNKLCMNKEEYNLHYKTYHKDIWNALKLNICI